ncbi:MAG: hypothetical protein Q3Y11_09185 [Phocaeicola sp.]|nr:hypothetical protein [Phocaeicola sp.]
MKKQKERLERRFSEKQANKCGSVTGKKELSRTGIKKGVPLNSNLC